MNTRDYYNTTASNYDAAFFAPRPYTVEMRFNVLLQLVDGKYAHKNDYAATRILEIGAGTGAYTGKLATLNPQRLTVTDISSQMLEQAKKNMPASFTNIDFCVCESENLPFENNSFDLIVCFACLHHFSNSTAAFAEMARVLDTGGSLLFMEPNPLHPMNCLMGLSMTIERGMLKSWPSRWKNEAAMAGLKYVNFRFGSFFPPWPKLLTPLYSMLEPLLQKIPLLCNFAIFGFYRFDNIRK